MKTTTFIVIGVTLCVLFALVGLLIPYVQVLPLLTVALCCTTGLLCIGGILHYMMNGNV